MLLVSAGVTLAGRLLRLLRVAMVLLKPPPLKLHLLPHQLLHLHPLLLPHQRLRLLHPRQHPSHPQPLK